MKFFILPIAWMLLIFVVSTDLGSMDNTQSFLRDWIRLVFPSVSAQALSRLIVGVRKLGHLGEYGILALLWLVALIQGGKTITSKPFRYALFVTVFYAGLDEVHHSFVESRTGSLMDVAIDATGAALALLAWKGWQTWSHRQNEK